MGHNVKLFTYPISKSQAEITQELSSYVEHACWQEGGTLGRIRWLSNKIYDSYDAAEAAIEKQDKGWYDNIAVQFHQCDDDKKLMVLREKESAAWKAYRTADSAVFAADFLSKMISCKKCGSKLNREYLKFNYCPLCHADMRSPTLLKKIDRLKKAAEAASKAVEDYRQELGRKSKNVFWMVKIEYHQ